MKKKEKKKEESKKEGKEEDILALCANGLSFSEI